MEIEIEIEAGMYRQNCIACLTNDIVPNMPDRNINYKEIAFGLGL